ncbi:hypothetical protein AB0H76_26735 [Nocardia sp. NPDC050712]|uniref:hypothetical protein n=1 Tax=Nocardia sp. NPDC050712 TaxID=3155518 RepID=UPI0033CC48AD
MRIRRALTALGLLTAGAAVAGALQCGTAAAASIYADTDEGTFFVALSHGETAALSNSPVPAVLDGIFQSSATVIILGNFEDDEFFRVGSPAEVGVSFPEVFRDAAAVEDGGVAIGFDNSGASPGRPLLVITTRE